MPQNITETGRRAHSIAETCALTGLGRDTVYSAIRDGHLVARKLGRRTLITDDDLRRLSTKAPASTAGYFSRLHFTPCTAFEEHRCTRCTGGGALGATLGCACWSSMKVPELADCPVLVLMRPA